MCDVFISPSLNAWLAVNMPGGHGAGDADGHDVCGPGSGAGRPGTGMGSAGVFFLSCENIDIIAR